ncbi:MAG TPA: PLP-dependent aminotransferase family protein [Gemmatimonadaceae bacterium]
MDLHIIITDGRAVSGQVYRQIREAIIDGRLRPRDALPSTRELARRLRIARNSVLEAYERLRAEGYLESRHGSGTFVRDGVARRADEAVRPSPLKPRSLWDSFPDGVDMAATTAEFDLRPGTPDAASFPYASWRARVARQFHHHAVGLGAHIGPAGHHGLRDAIARHIAISRGVHASPDDVVITNGSQQAIDLIARVLLEPGDTVAVEDPGYPLPRHALRANGCRVVGVPVDGEGLMVDALPSDARLVYVTPSHQFPLGMAMTTPRRQALLAWAERADATIVEDDYDSEFRYGGRPLPSLQGLDESGRVLYVGSLSKVLLPTLRLGFVVVPPALRSALRRAKFAADWHTAVPLQAAAAEFIDDGLLARHLRRMRRVYAERHDRIMQILERDFAGRLTPLPSNGGLHLAAWVTDGLNTPDVTIVERAREVGVAVLPLSRYYLDVPPRHGLLIGYGAVHVSRVDDALRRLSHCL